MRILLTGGTGFIGKSFKEAYGGKHEIVAPSSSALDLTDIAACSGFFSERSEGGRKPFDAVLHCAGKADSNSKKLVEADNLIMFKNLQYTAILNGIKKLIVVGDTADFDRTVPLRGVTEEDFGKSIPRDGYGLGRYLVTLLAGKDKISTTLRFFPVFGKNAKALSGPVMPLIYAGLKGRPIDIKRDFPFSYIYIDDALKIIAAFLENDYPKGDYNIAADNPASVLEAAKAVKSAVRRDGRTAEIRFSGEEGGSYTCNNSKLKAIMPSLRFSSLKTAVSKTFDALGEKLR